MKLLASLAGLLALSACVTAPPSADALQPGAHYVALGSSFAAGAGIGPLQAGSPERCARNTNNYASLLARRLGLRLEDRSCSGATTAHLLAPWEELPAQLDGVTPATRLVTITVGGNDLDYMGLLFTASCDLATGMMYRGERVPCPPIKLPPPTQADYAQLEADLTAIATQARQAAPEAQIVFVQYVSLVPEILCEATPLEGDDAQDARQLAARLAQVTASAAQKSGALVLAADKLSASHTVCDDAPWSNGFPADPDQPGAPWHPTAPAHAAIADALAGMLAS